MSKFDTDFDRYRESPKFPLSALLALFFKISVGSIFACGSAFDVAGSTQGSEMCPKPCIMSRRSSELTHEMLGFHFGVNSRGLSRFICRVRLSVSRQATSSKVNDTNWTERTERPGSRGGAVNWTERTTAIFWGAFVNEMNDCSFRSRTVVHFVHLVVHLRFFFFAFFSINDFIFSSPERCTPPAPLAYNWQSVVKYI